MKEKVYFTIYLFVDFLVESNKGKLLDFMPVFYLTNLFCTITKSETVCMVYATN